MRSAAVFLFCALLHAASARPQAEKSGLEMSTNTARPEDDATTTEMMVTQTQPPGRLLPRNLPKEDSFQATGRMLDSLVIHDDKDDHLHRLDSPGSARLLSRSDEYGDNGAYGYSFETSNGIKMEQQGFFKKVAGLRGRNFDDNIPDEEEDVFVQTGSYSYVAPGGEVVSVSYIADENGFRPTGTHIHMPAYEGEQRSFRTVDSRGGFEGGVAVAPRIAQRTHARTLDNARTLPGQEVPRTTLEARLGSPKTLQGERPRTLEARLDSTRTFQGEGPRTLEARLDSEGPRTFEARLDNTRTFQGEGPRTLEARLDNTRPFQGEGPRTLEARLDNTRPFQGEGPRTLEARLDSEGPRTFEARLDTSRALPRTLEARLDTNQRTFQTFDTPRTLEGRVEINQAAPVRTLEARLDNERQYRTFDSDQTPIRTLEARLTGPNNQSPRTLEARVDGGGVARTLEARVDGQASFRTSNFARPQDKAGSIPYMPLAAEEPSSFVEML